MTTKSSVPTLFFDGQFIDVLWDNHENVVNLRRTSWLQPLGRREHGKDKIMNELILNMFKEYNISSLDGGGTNALYMLDNSGGDSSVLKIAMLSNYKAKTEEMKFLRKVTMCPN